MKGLLEYPVSRFATAVSVTVMSPYAAPGGTVTVNDAAFPVGAAAFEPPKYTTFLIAGSLKAPKIVTVVPTEPDVGAKDETTGTCAHTRLVAAQVNAAIHNVFMVIRFMKESPLMQDSLVHST
jgi:hypothetical protein